MKGLQSFVDWDAWIQPHQKADYHVPSSVDTVGAVDTDAPVRSFGFVSFLRQSFDRVEKLKHVVITWDLAACEVHFEVRHSKKRWIVVSLSVSQVNDTLHLQPMHFTVVRNYFLRWKMESAVDDAIVARVQGALESNQTHSKFFDEEGCSKAVYCCPFLLQAFNSGLAGYLLV